MLEVLKNETSPPLLTTLLSFLNCLINTPEELDDRMALRNELLAQGLANTLGKSITSLINQYSNLVPNFSKIILF